jgi:hypothetical protein
MSSFVNSDAPPGQVSLMGLGGVWRLVVLIVAVVVGGTTYVVLTIMEILKKK